MTPEGFADLLRYRVASDTGGRNSRPLLIAAFLCEAEAFEFARDEFRQNGGIVTLTNGSTGVVKTITTE